ncbi:hypothetical protein CRUP_025933 [Coryphaenoides rupestris]|nr:hypothetical protein CRUP_025933 [Coryphaenoides rupestris]
MRPEKVMKAVPRSTLSRLMNISTTTTTIIISIISTTTTSITTATSIISTAITTTSTSGWRETRVRRVRRAGLTSSSTVTVFLQLCSRVVKLDVSSVVSDRNSHTEIWSGILLLGRRVRVGVGSRVRVGCENNRSVVAAPQMKRESREGKLESREEDDALISA